MRLLALAVFMLVWGALGADGETRGRFVRVESNRGLRLRHENLSLNAGGAVSRSRCLPIPD